ncbi:hypothetical protein [Bacillus cereus]|uniref:hypothetical protein n=1 Tax=Bacillus cereus TaxID=1396 RepID=UPI000BF8B246|nr:hypothetical protein [Bacillus cereus]PFA86211.1 hypothetical protein CN393_23055 [Bacillus cereus]
MLGARVFFINSEGVGKIMEDYYVMWEQETMQIDSKQNEEDAINTEEMKVFNRMDRELTKL